ncbi:MAG: hypothetical protein V3R78_06555 [Thermodesulfobacteriota bacterium]
MCEDSDQEGGGLTGTRLCLACDIHVCEGLWQCHGLDRGTVFKPEIIDPMHDLDRQFQVMKACLPFC